MLRRQPLEGGHRVAVVAVLGVVVVLHDQGVAAARPAHQGSPPLRRHHHAGRVLVGGRDDHRVHARRLELGDHEATRVHPDRHRLEARVAHAVRLAGPAGVLDPDPRGAALSQGAPDHRHPVRDAGADQDAAGLAHGGACASEVVGERHPQAAVAARPAVEEPRVGQLAHRAGGGGLPAAAGKRGHVGEAGPQVVAGRGLALHRRARPRRPGADGLRHARSGAAARGQVALGHQLGVGVDHDPPRDAELPRQRPAGRQRSAGTEAARADAVAQLALELGAARGGGLECQQQVHDAQRTRSGAGLALSVGNRLALPIGPIMRSVKSHACCGG